MAILANNNDDQDPNNPNGGQNNQPGGVQTATGNTSGGGGGYVGGGTGQGATTTNAPAPGQASGGQAGQTGSSSGSYTNLKTYLDANQGAGAQMGSAVEHVVDTAGQGADKAIGDYTSAGNSAIAGTQAATQKQASGIKGTGVDQNVVSSINGGLKTGANTTSVNPDGSTTITGGRQTYTTPNVSWANAHMAAPTASQVQAPSYGGVLAALDPLQGYVQNAQNGQAGASQLLQKAYGDVGPSYTRGQNTLDGFLTTAGGGQQALGQIQTDWGGEGDKGQSAKTGMEKAVGTANTNDQSLLNNATSAANTMNANTNKSYASLMKKLQDQASGYQPTSTTTAAPAAPKPAPSNELTQGHGRLVGVSGQGRKGGMV